MCQGRADANGRGPGVWYSDAWRSWLWVPDGLEGAVAVTHCPYCRFPLPRLLDAVLRALRAKP